MADSFIQTGVKYRIQNADFLTYIECVDYTDEVEMRPFKVSEKQQWIFEKTNSRRLRFHDSDDEDPRAVTDGIFRIRNVACSTKYLVAGPGWHSDKLRKPCVRIVETHETDGEWDVLLENGSYYIYCYLNMNCFYFETEDTLNFKLKITTETGCKNQAWNMVPVTPIVSNSDPPPTGNYRIRSFDGANLLTAPSDDPTEDSNVFVRFADVRVHDSQMWLFTRKDNGLYSIKGPEKDEKYLGCGPTNTAWGDGVTYQSVAFEWDLRSLGSGFAWSITIPRSPLSIGFASYHTAPESNVSLQLSDGVPSQLWFFEKCEAAK